MYIKDGSKPSPRLVKRSMSENAARPRGTPTHRPRQEMPMVTPLFALQSSSHGWSHSRCRAPPRHREWKTTPRLSPMYSMPQSGVSLRPHASRRTSGTRPIFFHGGRIRLYRRDPPARGRGQISSHLERALFLNDFGIQDEYWTPQFFTSHIRIFDPSITRWRVTFFRMPGYHSGVWEGVPGRGSPDHAPGRPTTGPGLTFYNITEEGFDWRSGDEDAGWQSTCTRRR